MSARPTMREALQKFAADPLGEAKLRFDGWMNDATGFGTWRDKSTWGRYTPFMRLDDVELSAMYHSEDMAARVVDIVPQEMLREGFEVDLGDKDANTVLAEKLDALRVEERMADGIRWGRLYGGAALLMGCDDGQDPSKPLKPERAKDVKYLYVIERRVLWPNTFYSTPGHPKLGEPETYVVTPMVAGGVGAAPIIVHETRLLLFRGAKTGAFERMQMAGWDISVLQRPYEVLRQFNTGWKAVEILLTDGNQAVFKMTGLADMIASGQETALRKRLTIMEIYRSVMRALVIDADSEESFERNSITFAGIPETLDKFMLRLAAAAQVPVTILMGQSPAGMNATGESDFRWFYDRMRNEQTVHLAPLIRRLVMVWLETEAGQQACTKPVENVTVKFPPLWRETPMNEATRRKAIADADCAYVLNQVYLPEEVALSRSRPEGFNDDVIKLEDKARQSREALLKGDLDKLAAGTLNPVIAKPMPAGAVPPVAGAPGKPGAPAFGAPKPKPALPAAPPAAKLDADEGDKPPAAHVDADFDESAHPRDEHGRFGEGGGGAHAMAASLAATVQTQGGVTTHPDAGGAPTTGIMVSRAPDEKLGHVIDVQAMVNASPPPSASELHGRIVMQTEEWLGKALPGARALGPDHFLGGWAEKDAHGDIKAIHFDVSQRFEPGDRAKAVAAGASRNQLAVYDIGSGTEIPTGGTGRSTS